MAVIIGKDDQIINYKIYDESGLPLLGGPDNNFRKILPGNHDFVMTHTNKALQKLGVFWGLEQETAKNSRLWMTIGTNKQPTPVVAVCASQSWPAELRH
ncbi:C6 and C2H2 transcription factor RegA-like protein [Colletotrichum tofieldiae]|nr:C6 and C2H2 transcription factor RegA-like protein [Colletotrichum tofieldiae]